MKRHKELVGPVAIGHAGLGSTPITHYNKLKGKERRDLVQKEVRVGIEEQRASQMVGLRQQGAWTRWEDAMERKISWAELCRAQPYCIKFLIQSVYDTLPIPYRLRHVPCVREEDRYNTSSAAVLKHLGKAATAGAMTKC